MVMIKEFVLTLLIIATVTGVSLLWSRDYGSCDENALVGIMLICI